MVAAAAGSYFTTAKPVHVSNDFNFNPIKEVAILFAGIFATMLPALDWLQANAAQLGHPAPGFFFWGSGALSSVLDNSPTYLSFLSAEYGAFTPPERRRRRRRLHQGPWRRPQRPDRCHAACRPDCQASPSSPYNAPIPANLPPGRWP